jgi:hypothetical protein
MGCIHLLRPGGPDVMAALRRVFANQAGPTALGILVPPGRRTAVVVRPRSLPWDLLMIDDRDTSSIIRFRDFAREEAEAAAEAFAQALDECTAGCAGRIEIIPAPGSAGQCLRVDVGRFCLIACPRMAGQAYRPMVFASADAASDAARALREILQPSPKASQELYFNWRHFGRT